MIRRYTNIDYPMIHNWFRARGIHMAPEDLSDIGFIRNNAAAVFLYETGTRMAVIENLVTNPDVPLSERYHAVREVLKKALEICRFRKYRVYGFTRSKSVSRITRSLGFESLGCFELLRKGD